MTGLVLVVYTIAVAALSAVGGMLWAACHRGGEVDVRACLTHGHAPLDDTGACPRCGIRVDPDRLIPTPLARNVRIRREDLHGAR